MTANDDRTDLMAALIRSVERKGGGHGPAQGSGIKPPTPTSRGAASDNGCESDRKAAS